MDEPICGPYGVDGIAATLRCYRRRLELSLSCGRRYHPAEKRPNKSRVRGRAGKQYSVPEPIDVIIPVYNGPIDIIRSCIDSVILASRQNTYHIIVIDDRSTDGNIVSYLKSKEMAAELELLTNDHNLGFVRTVNRGMAINKNRDVILLNSDTVVYGPWAERMRCGAYSNKSIATVNPLSNGWMSNYPTLGRDDGDNYLEVGDDVLNDLCLEINLGKNVQVPHTIGFCMFIKRQCVDEIGLFDHRNFAEGYGEETDFCFRANAVGWTHAVVGDVFVRHWQTKSFTSGNRQKRLEDAVKRFQILYPNLNYQKTIERFAHVDPQRTLRTNLDLARLKRRFGTGKQLSVVFDNTIKQRQSTTPPVFLNYRREQGCVQLNLGEGNEKFPNLELYRASGDAAGINTMLSYLGVEELLFSSHSELKEFERQVSGLPIEIKIKAELKVNPSEFSAMRIGPAVV